MPRRKHPESPAAARIASWDVPIEVDASSDAKRLEWRYHATRPVRWGERELSPAAAKGMTRTAHATAALLPEFLDLAPREVPASSIAAYARRWGVFHHRGEVGKQGSDDARRWRADARLYAAILAAMTDLRERATRLEPGHWRTVARSLGEPLPDARDLPGLAGGAFLVLLSRAVREHVLRHVRLFPSLGVERARGLRFEALVGGGDLRGALCAELVRELQGEAGRLVVCDGCGGRAVPQTQAGRRSFCAACRRRGIPNDLAKRDVRMRRQRARDAAQGGGSVELAARAAYGREPSTREVETVRGWLASEGERSDGAARGSERPAHKLHTTKGSRKRRSR